MIVRAATQLDIEKIMATEVSASQRFRDLGMDWVADMPTLTARSIAGFIADLAALVAHTDDGETLGFILLTQVDTGGHIVEISTAYQARGLGVGHKLMQAGEAWAREHDFRYMSLTTFRDVPFNGAWYQRLGYTEITPDCDYPELAARLAAERSGPLSRATRTAMIKALNPIEAMSTEYPENL